MHALELTTDTWAWVLHQERHCRRGEEQAVGGAPGGAPKKREQGERPAAEQAQPVVDLVDVKEEPVDECKHTNASEAGVPWPRQVDMRVKVWGGNKLEPGQLEAFIQFLDASLMQGNMRAWSGMQAYLLENDDAFTLYKMATKSGEPGAMLECRACAKACKMHWQSTDTLEDEQKEKCRLRLRAFLGFATQGRAHQRIQ